MRYAIGIEYDGSAFLGWQIQRQEPTVQGCVERAVASVADHEARVTCSGRTDTGVHALCQVAHFDSDSTRPERSWILGFNSNLPDGISVLWIREVDDSFHARFSAFARSYRYQLLNRWIRPALDAHRRSWCRTPLDADKMHEAAQALLGEHDFTSFRARACQARHAVREIQHISVERSVDTVSLDVTANGFLYHMVRNIAGCLIRVGCGEEKASWVKQVLDKKDRTEAAPTAPPEGLYFLGARYPESYGLPDHIAAFPRGWNLS
ncbi:MAG: tRNA pseudouridine(38-40) synthase TruA [Xanthomonadales bacterium]|nr:tRNA pseudouridine(38-40) synthase TruA [Gammaproteobacteria bacterium]MBT8054703.1 tRNA pseudouridine(38-40) synthase TruA [Gammaproteobacteria bacterium]NND57803.1 tRNA pseudouridine(38-40) synthase TruA [Xanthomonadales bacterium]NNK51452.1 tRNA pseudouridine(38-40) synthase TruA [Xanthomonadales bacterium]